ncbi:DUF896 domain-containing protein [Caloramator proteoclasticus]|uniref:UPF0291 protein SAMN02746091_00610 n=1 Tax=Caloramator proteoclasticus DSM 10124 TaxID=1121262 RepID=A0A1M4UBJ6_9CLOT|nr:Uncharacterized protein YnzC, UPF0291/DUF896 family [Caloramator proteoclasticus DSM 10124]
MITKEQIQRINELYRKSQQEGLTEEEKKEQAYLRRLYIDSVKESLRAQLENIKVVDKDEYDEIMKNKGCSCGHEHGSCGCGHKH